MCVSSILQGRDFDSEDKGGRERNLAVEKI
jgi:hypothetical protein